MRLALDTTILVSSMRSALGPSRFLVNSALRRAFEMILSVPLALEYEDVLLRPEHLANSEISSADVTVLLRSLFDVAIKVPLGRFKRPNLPDPGDEHVLNLALRGRADGLVTSNTRHFRILPIHYGIKIYSPQEAAGLLRSR